MCVGWVALALGTAGWAASPLTTLEYRISGTGLQVSPAAVSVPKGIAGSVNVTLVGGEATQALTNGAYVEAFLRGPGIPEPRRIVSAVNQPMLFPPLNLVGDYQLDSIRLVDAVTGETRMEGSPSIVPVRVFDEVLVSRVTSRPLTYEEIQEKGIFIDESNFRVVEFEAAFVLDGKTVPITFPVVSPKFFDSVELIPAAELEEKLARAAVLNSQIASTTALPPEFEVSQLNIQVQGINFQVVDPGEDEPLGLKVPPIPALMVIPGNIGYLNQFFSVQIFTENGAPLGSGLSVYNVKAELKLPPGPDQVVAPDYAHPGDDPLRFARIGPEKVIQPIQSIVQPGSDGKVGTPDDQPRISAGQSGQAEFLVEGLQEGLHVMDLDLTADMDGLAAGPVQVKGKAAGSVLVRNPRFSMAFSHPRTVRVGEPYEASVTLLNTGITPANLVQITLNKNSISGARLEDETQQTVELGTLLPGQSATATFRLRSLRTGAVSFSNLTTSEDSVVGRLRLSMGVDERGVALSPDSIAMPDQVNSLPPALLFAANRVLGQALSVATAGQLPPGLLRVGRSIITRRVLDLAEAGQRLSYGDPAKRVFADLLRDWEGGREASAGFDQILRETEAGREWRDALFAVMEAADGLTGTERLVDRAADYAGLGQEFVLASGNTGSLRLNFGSPGDEAAAERSAHPFALVYSGTNGVWADTLPNSNGVVIWAFTNGPPTAEMAVLLVATNGTARQLRWTVPSPPVDALYSFALGDLAGGLRVDLLSDGVTDSTLSPTVSTIQELPPTLLAVEQDLYVLSGRPGNPCIGPDYRNYGTVVAVVFSKPMTAEGAGDPAAYTVDGDNGANSVQVQPGGRVAYLNLRKGISAIRPRALTLTGVVDGRGNALPVGSRPIRMVERGTEVPFTGGVAIRGRAIKGDGTPAPGIPVTLTMYDQAWGPYSCESWTRRVSQVLTDAAGNFDFDFVMAGIPYSISATDTSGLSQEALTLIAGNTADGQVERERILQLATSAATRDSLLGLFASGSIPEAIAKVEGLDRALIRDVVQIDSSREGQTVPIALRFRGRATVIGRVVAADGVTPVPRPAVNLYPDSGSRELGRGIFADNEGRFAFYGVPLGVYTVEVQTADRRTRTVAGLLDTSGEVASLTIELPSTVTPTGHLRGTVFEADNLTPHAHARVFIGSYGGSQVTDVVRIVETDADGNWHAEGLPARPFDIVAISFDGRRKGTRIQYPVATAVTSVANLSLEATTQLLGRVQFEDGRPAANALVAGGLALVRTDVNGNFSLEGVPVGNRQISAGVERDPAAGIDFPRLGSAMVNVVAGANNFVVVKLRAAGRVYGKVTDLNGAGIPNIRVAIPIDGGFFWTDADGQGNYVFENLGLGHYTLSAPANATAPQLDVAKLTEQIRSGNEDEILTAFEEAVRVFVGADDPLVTGAQLNFRPITWGFTEATLRFDGQSVQANVRMLREGSVKGRVLNHQGVPIGARVRLTGLGPARNGEPKITIRGERDSDPATGEFIFPGQLLVGPWSVQAASPFYPAVIQVNGFTTEIDPNATNVVLQFLSIRETNGRLAGRVLNPDGTAAGEGVRVKINFSADYEIRTDTNGFFDTQIAVPAGGYRAEAIDDASGLRGEAYVTVAAGQTNLVDVSLLTRDSTVEVTVIRGNGLPAVGAQVDLEQGTYPREARLTVFADASGKAVFGGLWEGRYAVSAQYAEASTRVFGRGGTAVGPRQVATVTLRLGATGSITGRFVKPDQVTAIEAAQVSIGNLGFASTDQDGRFRFDGVPLGSYGLVTSDPVTGAFARGTATVSFADQVTDVLLVEGVRGLIDGYVIDSYGVKFAAGATVRIHYSDGLTPSVTVTTGPDGRFFFPGSPVGAFSVSATDLPKSQGGRGTGGSASGVLDSVSLATSLNIQLQPLGTLPVTVVRADGTTPAQNVTVSLNGVQRDTDELGGVHFDDLPLGNYGVTAVSRAGGERHNGVQGRASVGRAGTNQPVTLRLPGVGAVEGVVLGSDGITPVGGAEVVITFQASVFAGETVTAVSDPFGLFSFADVPVGDYRLAVASVSLAASRNDSIDAGGEVDSVTLRLGDSGALLGRLVRADGVSPVAGVDVLVTYASQSANPGRAFDRTDAQGLFDLTDIPVGAFDVEVVAPEFGGLIRISRALTANGQRLDLGDLVFDEAFPTVVSVTPANTSIGVPTTATVVLEFSEEISAGSVNIRGVLLRSASTGERVEATLELIETNGVARVVHLRPTRPLVSEQLYEVIVLAGDLLNAGGGVIGSGPRDRVGRSLLVPFVSRFITADNDPPVLLSLFPAEGALQIDPRAVPRLSFNETLRPTGHQIVLTGPTGPVTGQAAVGVDGRVLSFVPSDLLRPNSVYTLTVSNVFDLAGNRAAGEPFIATFATLDTVGPSIASLQIVNGRLPVAGSTLPVEALLTINEPGATVRFTQDFAPLGSAPNPPYRLNVTLPQTGRTTIRAIASDSYGNDGPFQELVLVVQTNQPPTLAFSLISPSSPPAPSGSFVSVEILAADDSTIAELTATISGLTTSGLVRTNGPRLRVEGLVPTDAGPGSRIRIVAEATDDVGQSTGPQSWVVDVSDGTVPTLSLTGPAAGTLIEPGAVVPLAVRVTDNFGVTVIEGAVAGAFEATIQTPLDPAVTDGTRTVDLAVPAATPADGRSVQVSLLARDAAGNVSAGTGVELRLVDRISPTIVAVTPRDGATGVDIRERLRVVFSERLDTNTVTTDTLTLRRAPDGIPVPASVELAADLLTATVDPVALLEPETSYELVVAGSVADPSGNVLGLSVTNQFRTAEFRLVRPADGDRVIEGQSLTLEAASATLSFSKVRFLIDDLELSVVASAPFVQPYLVPSLAELGGSQLIIGAEALDGTDQVLARATAELTVHAGSEDSDGDGVSNADELVRGTDPFTPNAVPEIQFNASLEVIQGVQTNVLVRASDPDGNLRRMEVRESLDDEETRLFRVLRFAESGTGTLSSGQNIPELSGTLQLNYPATNEVRIFLRAVDSDGLAVSRSLTISVLADLDGDALPDREDPDVDGDGLSNDAELAIGTNPRSPDTDDDSIADGEEVVAGTDGFVTDPLQRDTDADTVDDAFEIALGLDPTDPSDGAHEIVIDNRTVTYSGDIRVGSLVLTNGAVLTSRPATPAGAGRLDLIVTNLVVSGTSRIDVSGRGFPGALTAANASGSGTTYGNATGGGSTRRNGGSYGGLGAVGNTEATVGTVYGSFRDPNEAGSGGGSDSGPAGSGGGLIRITAQSVLLDGQLLANGSDGSYYGGGGSGGGIKVSTDSLSGSGAIRANGGGAGGVSGGGGGGRIALYFSNASQIIRTNALALGGDGGTGTGTAGTVYWEEAGSPGELRIDGGTSVNATVATPLISLAGGTNSALSDHALTDRRARFTPGALIGLSLKPKAGVNRTYRIVANNSDTLITDPTDGRLTDIAGLGDAYATEFAVDRLIIRRGATVESFDGDSNRLRRLGRLRTQSVELTDAARLTHPAANGLSEFGIEWTVADALMVDASSVIDVTGRGYLGGLSGANANASAGRTLGNTPVGGSTRRNGGSYGGLGAVGNTEPITAPVYGSFAEPNEVGSGGGSDSGAAGAGGGLIRITAGTMALEGALVADGGRGSYYGGGGSGGGVHLVTGRLTGRGRISADGGGGGVTSGGGGGGRIAVLYPAGGDFDWDRVTANGGADGYAVGGAGTVYLKEGDRTPTMVIHSSGRETPLPPTLAGVDLLVDGATVVATQVNMASLTLTNGAVLTHPAADLATVSHLELTVGRLVISTNSRIDVGGRGYLGGLSGANASSPSGRTAGNTTVGGSTRRNGGSYGGLGAVGNTESTVGDVYGNYASPSDVGSGGGSDSGPAGAGGGRVRIVADSILLEGRIAANGGVGSYYGGGGSGGAVWLTTGSLTGEGQVLADGGSGGVTSGGGGGGRIAVECPDMTGFAFTNLQARGGVGFSTGGAGTVYLKEGSATPLLVIRGTGRETPLPPFVLGDHLVVDGATVAATRIRVTSFTLTNGAVLTHPGGGLGLDQTLDLNVTTLVVDATSRIDADGRGYLGGLSGANRDSQSGRTLGNTIEGGSQRRSGGSYGGLGAPGNTRDAVAAVYGHYGDPAEMGSGGGSDSGAAGSGGGLVRIAAGRVFLEGRITANGGQGSYYGGGGSGGGIRLVSDSLTGGGQILANGGVGDATSGGGGGGRIAIRCADLTGFSVTNLQANGAAGYRLGGAGTVYVAEGNGTPTLVIRGSDRETPLPGIFAGEHLMLDGATVVATNVTLSRLTLTNGAVLTHPFNDLGPEQHLDVSVTTLTVDASSRIDVSGRGYLGGLSGANAGSQSGRTLGNTLVGGSTRRNGGSYGGQGAVGTEESTTALTYGSFFNPDQLGSGGGSDSGAAGSGGGLVRIAADSLALEGRILAEGADGSYYGGGGSGGGILVMVGTLTGGGQIRVTGGNYGITSGAGGGGRVAVHYQNAARFDLDQVQSVGGGGGARPGAPGTVYLRDTVNQRDRLLIDARAGNISGRATTFWSLAGGASSLLGAHSLTDTNANFVPGGLVGLLLNPRTGQSRTFTIIANTATDILTEPAEGNLTDVAVAGDAYSAARDVNEIAVRGGAVLELADADQSRVDRRGYLAANVLQIMGGSGMTHPPATGTTQFGLQLNIADTLTVDSTSRMDVSGRGYLGAHRGDNAADTGRTAGNSNQGGSTSRNGGSYGGMGGTGSRGGSLNALYGVAADPDDNGSGGGSDSGPAGSGGGVLRVEAATFQLDGELLADGGVGSYYGGGGSGGSVSLRVRTIRGSGKVHADGGGGGVTSGGGGGGRVALLYEDASGFSLANLLSLGGAGFTSGEFGTVFTQREDFLAAVPMIEEIFFQSPAVVRSTESSEGVTGAVVIRWSGRPNSAFIVETSLDLAAWEEWPAQAVELSPGYYEGQLSPSLPDHAFFRVRLR